MTENRKARHFKSPWQEGFEEGVRIASEKAKKQIMKVSDEAELKKSYRQGYLVGYNTGRNHINDIQERLIHSLRTKIALLEGQIKAIMGGK